MSFEAVIPVHFVFPYICHCSAFRSLCAKAKGYPGPRGFSLLEVLKVWTSGEQSQMQENLWAHTLGSLIGKDFSPWYCCWGRRNWAFLMHQEWHDIFSHVCANGFRFALPWTVKVYLKSFHVVLVPLKFSFTFVADYLGKPIRFHRWQSLHNLFFNDFFCCWTSCISFCQVQLDCICTLGRDRPV